MSWKWMRNLVFTAVILILTGAGNAMAAWGANELETEKIAVTFAREVERGGYKIVSTSELKGWIDEKKAMLIVDTMTAQTVCHAPVAAQSSESVAVGGLLNPDDADDAVRADLRDQLQVAATDALRSISADLFLGTSPTIGR